VVPLCERHPAVAVLVAVGHRLRDVEQREPRGPVPTRAAEDAGRGVLGLVAALPAGRSAAFTRSTAAPTTAAAASTAPATKEAAAARTFLDAHRGDLRNPLALVGLHLEAIDEAVAVGVQQLEEPLAVGAELLQRHRAVVVRVGAGQPGAEAVRSAERLAHRADEQAHPRPGLGPGFTALHLDDRRGLRRRGVREAGERRHQEKPSKHPWKSSVARRPA